MESIYNYIIITDTRKEYLIRLCDYLLESHTDKFLTSEISNIIEQFSSNKFTTVIIDNASNCQVVRQNIQQTYPHIWNLHYVAHAINLIISDLVKIESIKKFISECDKINRYFNISYANSVLLKQGFTNIKIKGGGLQTWIKTYWRSLYMTTDALLRA